MVAILMISAKLLNLGLLKLKRYFQKRGYDVIISVHDFTNKILSRDPNYTNSYVCRSYREKLVGSIFSRPAPSTPHPHPPFSPLSWIGLTIVNLKVFMENFHWESISSIPNSGPYTWFLFFSLFHFLSLHFSV